MSSSPWPWTCLAAALTTLCALRRRGRRRFRAEEWRYAAEGALNVALRYVGDDPSYRGHVLRLRKRRGGHHHHQHPPTMALGFSVRFVEEVMVGLLGRRFVPRNEVVGLSREFLESVDEAMRAARPQHRRVHALDMDSLVGVLMRDHARLACTCGEGACQGDAYCVEIKPKWGVRFPESQWEVKRRVDRFTMHQQLKLATPSPSSTHPTEEISAYDPMQLFHGDLEEALARLRHTPQNNLRVFKHGVLMDAEAMAQDQANLDEVFHVVSCVLREREDVLQRILRAQVLVPPWYCPAQRVEEMLARGEAPSFADIETVYPLYEAMQRRGEPLPDLLGRDDGAGTTATASGESPGDLVRAFLISCTSRDCSVMVALSTCPHLCHEPKGVVQQSLSRSWAYDVAVVDLDPKPVGKMKAYYDTDQDIASLYSRLEKTGGLVLASPRMSVSSDVTQPTPSPPPPPPPQQAGTASQHHQQHLILSRLVAAASGDHALQR